MSGVGGGWKSHSTRRSCLKWCYLVLCHPTGKGYVGVSARSALRECSFHGAAERAQCLAPIFGTSAPELCVRSVQTVAAGDSRKKEQEEDDDTWRDGEPGFGTGGAAPDAGGRRPGGPGCLFGGWAAGRDGGGLSAG